MDMQTLYGKNILLGISGGIAAYKGAELTRLLVKSSARVRVMMTKGAQAFVTPLTFQALSGNLVHTRLLDEAAWAGMGHIELARWADRIVIAPASANFIARLAHGMADDLLSTCCLASEAALLLAPAMNRVMWEKPQTQANIASLRSQGTQILGPDNGSQACGETGHGRMIEPSELLIAINRSFAQQVLAGLNVLITAGPTREAIDPVRYMSNRSSGKMGFALAMAAREAGADVTLISGPVNLKTPSGVSRVDVTTAGEMGQAVLDRVADYDILMSAAAVADYIPVRNSTQKIKKSSAALNLEFKPGMDILHEVSRLDTRPFTVGFAADTESIAAHALDKRLRKRLDMIAANDVSQQDRGFDVDDNELTVYWENGKKHLPLADKSQIARRLVQLVGQRYHAAN